eukprot:16434083-Heterocapsa_arctica.AAC.1
MVSHQPGSIPGLGHRDVAAVGKRRGRCQRVRLRGGRLRRLGVLRLKNEGCGENREPSENRLEYLTHFKTF